VPILVVALVVVFSAAAALAFILISSRTSSTPAAATASPATVFENTRQDCQIAAGYDVEDAGKTLNIVVGGAYLSDNNLACMVRDLHMPNAVMQHILSTRALDGQQTDSWPGYTARWTYHPDDGLQMTIRAA
jgi:hypothetical protein